VKCHKAVFLFYLLIFTVSNLVSQLKSQNYRHLFYNKGFYYTYVIIIRLTLAIYFILLCNLIIFNNGSLYYSVLCYGFSFRIRTHLLIPTKMPGLGSLCKKNCYQVYLQFIRQIISIKWTESCKY